MNLLTTSTSLSGLFYFIATVAMLIRLVSPKGLNLTLILSLGASAIVFHAIVVWQQLFLSDHINFTLPIVIALVSLVITTSVSLLVMKFNIYLLLPVTYGFAAIWQCVLIFIPSNSDIPLSADNILIGLHILLALIAYCILVIATLYTFQVNYINAKLKGKDFTIVNHLPPLMQVEHQLFVILTLGALSLLFSLIIGFLFVENLFAKEQLHKTVLSLTALLLYGITLLGHYKFGWRGHKVLTITTIATSILTLAYFGSRFVKEFVLS